MKPHQIFKQKRNGLVFKKPLVIINQLFARIILLNNLGLKRITINLVMTKFIKNL